eukprot:RCo030941
MAQPYVVWLGQPSIPVNLEFAAKFELHGVPWTPDLKQGPCVILRRVGDQQQYSKDSWYRLHTSRKEGFQWSAADSAHEAGDFEFTLQIGDRIYPSPSSGGNRVTFVSEGQPSLVWCGPKFLSVGTAFSAKFELHGVPWTPDLKQGPCVILRRVGDQQQYSKDSWYRLHTSRKEGFQWSAADS